MIMEFIIVVNALIFLGWRINEKINPVKLKHRTWKGKPKLDYELTASQKCASHEVYQHLSKGKDVILYASTGARAKQKFVLKVSVDI